MIMPINRLRAHRAQKAQAGRATAITLPAPVGGWNARDGLPMMKPHDAVTLTNWFPAATYVSARKGYTLHSVALNGYVETLMAFSGSTTNKFFAATSGGVIYDTTTADTLLTTEDGDYIYTEDGDNLAADAAGSTASISGLTNGRWQYVNMATSAGNYLRCVNGADKSRVYNGTDWFADGDGAPYDISGVDSATLIHINLHKNKMWFVETGSLRAWYLPTQAIGGAATAFDLRGVAQKGGYLMAMATWTIDAGYGVDDLAVWVTSNGEVIVYRGTDPSSATTWALVGVWNIGAPIGRRCMFKWAGDLLIITQDGVEPMSGALQSSRTNPRVAITDKIQSAIGDAIGTAGSNFGWQLLFHPNGEFLLLNVPLVERSTQQQYVMNTINKAWCNFTGWEAGCWELFENKPYFGGNGFVGLAWDSNDDAGEDIEVSGLQAFNYLGKPGIQKRVTMFQPILYTNGSPDLFGGVNVDFDTTENSTAVQTQTSLFGLWDAAVWDTGLWAPDLDLRKAWNGARGVGNAFAPTLNADINGIELQWVNSTIVFEEGGIL